MLCCNLRVSVEKWGNLGQQDGDGGVYNERWTQRTKESGKEGFFSKALLSSGLVVEWQMRHRRENKSIYAVEMNWAWLRKKSKGVERGGWVVGKEQEGMWRPHEPQKMGWNEKFDKALQASGGQIERVGGMGGDGAIGSSTSAKAIKECVCMQRDAVFSLPDLAWACAAKLGSGFVSVQWGAVSSWRVMI